MPGVFVVSGKGHLILDNLAIDGVHVKASHFIIR
jgi:hypothetical protein